MRQLELGSLLSLPLSVLGPCFSSVLDGNSVFLSYDAFLVSELNITSVETSQISFLFPAGVKKNSDLESTLDMS